MIVTYIAYKGHNPNQRPADGEVVHSVKYNIAVGFEDVVVFNGSANKRPKSKQEITIFIFKSASIDYLSDVRCT